MLKRILRALFGGKRALVTAPLVLGLGFTGFEAARYQLFYRAFSVGSRTGIVRKISSKRSSKGMPLCRYVAVEMVMAGNRPGLAAEVWMISVDDRQDLHRWWSCSESEYYVTAVE